MPGLNTTLFLFNSFKQNLVLLQLFVFSHPIVYYSEISLKGKTKFVEHTNFEAISNCDILLFNISFKSIVVRAILCYIFTGGIGAFVNEGDIYPLPYSILKSIPLLKPFPEIVSQLVCFYSLKFLLYVTKIYGINVTFTFDIILDLCNYLVCAFLLTLKFDIIFKIFIFKNNSYGLGIFVSWEDIISKSCAFQRILHFSSAFLIIVCVSQFYKEKSRLIISKFTHCGNRLIDKGNISERYKKMSR